ncbi:hypothetical protein [Streptomyces sp. NPDC086989]|uniref:hypothetical protein n=1 Tax=Streptomyces sp. NPDC086989 TaxID=3365764 RepID=UPI00380B8227
MVVLTPTVLDTRSRPWTTGWVAILLGALAVQLLLVLLDHLAPEVDSPEREGVPDPEPSCPAATGVKSSVRMCLT